MDTAKRKAIINQQAAKKKDEGGQFPKGTSSSNSSTKRKLPEKQDRLPKKLKTTMQPIVGLKAEGKKPVSPAKQGRGKGLMKGPSTAHEKPPILLCEDSKYALEQLSSIITSNDYEDLSNHVMEAIEEMRFFSIAQVVLSVHLLSVLSFYLSWH